MPSILAIISKKVFEKECEEAKPGTLYSTSLYRSSHKALAPLKDGGDIYLVTVRPPKESLWLVGVLRKPKKKKDGWSAKNDVPIADISALRSTLKFESGKGISQKKGALGMSLQTPRALSADDVKQIESLLGSVTTKTKKSKKAATKKTKKAAKKTKKAATKKTKKAATKKTQKAATKQKAATTSSATIQFSDEARKHLFPSTAEELKTKQRANRKALWRKWSATHQNSPFDPSLSVGFEEQAKLTDLLFRSVEPEDLSVGDMAVFIACAGYYTRNAIDYLLSRFSVDVVLQATIASHALHYNIRDQRYEERPADRVRPVQGERIYRAYLLADSDVQGRCSALAEAAYETADFELRLSLFSCQRHRHDWANELATEVLSQASPARFTPWVIFGVDDPALHNQLIEHYTVHADIVNLVAKMKERAVPLLKVLLEKNADYPNEQRSLARALSCVGTAESAEILVAHMRKKNVRGYATEFFARFPHLAEDALSELAKKKTKVAGVAREILEKIARAAAIGTGDADEVAPDEEVPEILRDPPWHAGKKPSRKCIVVKDIDVPDTPQKLHWPEASRRDWMVRNFQSAGIYGKRGSVEELRAKIESGERAYLYASYPASVTIPYLQDTPANLHVWRETPQLVLGFEGEKALSAVLTATQANHTRLTAEVYLHVESPALVPGLIQNWDWEAYGRVWMEKFPHAAVAGLVPFTCAMKKGAVRRRGEMILRYLARHGQRDLILEVAKSHGPDCQRCTADILAFDARKDGPHKPPKMPPFFRPKELRPPKLKSGKALPLWAVERLGEMLRFSTTDLPYVGIEEVRQACEPRSLAEFAWDLAQAWDTNGAKQSHIWMLWSVYHFGDDEVVRRLTPALRGEGISAMLGRIGTDAACMELQTIATRIAGLRQLPKYAYGTHLSMRLVAAGRGVSLEELTDQFVPACDLDEEGGVSLDLGDVRYRGHFDANLQPQLLDEKGNKVRSFPRSAKKEHPRKYEAAKARWKDVKEEVAAIAHQRSRALERAMLDQRVWSVDAFKQVWLEHPLMVRFGRATVWSAVDAKGDELRAFRVAEDKTYADDSDEPIKLPKATSGVRVAHPGLWDMPTLTRWRTIFEDYELLSPFAQLVRTPVPLLPEHAEATELRIEPTHDSTELIARLVELSWQGNRLHRRAFPDGFFVALEPKDKEWRMMAYREGHPRPFGELDAATYSEIRYLMTLF